jgi:hypothetical protein
MSAAATGDGAVAQDPEDVFELPAFYRHVRPLDRERRASTDALAFDGGALGGLNFRQQDRVKYETSVSDARRTAIRSWCR